MISPLNNGSFGMVSLGQDTYTGQRVALKCLVTTAQVSPNINGQYGQEQLDELFFHTRLGSHPNIVALLDSFQTSTHQWLVLELCPLGDLYDSIQAQKKPLDTEYVRGLMLQLVDAVSYMQSRNVYHRDLKPENIFLGKDGELKIGDFGLATTLGYAYDSCVGSDRYMAPEQYDSEGAGYAPSQVDIWALGIILLNILFSRNPFSKPTAADPLFVDFVRDRKALFEIFPNMSNATYEVLRHSLDLDPRRRSLSGLRAALTSVDVFTTDSETYDEIMPDHNEANSVAASRQPMRNLSLRCNGIAQPFPNIVAETGQAVRSSGHSLLKTGAEQANTEDLFDNPSKSLERDHGSDTALTPSLGSVWDSNLSSSFKSSVLDGQLRNSGGSVTAPIAIAAGGIGRVQRKSYRESVSKSWSDLWDEENEDTPVGDDRIALPKGLAPGLSSKAPDLVISKPRSLDCLRERAQLGGSPRRIKNYQRVPKKDVQDSRLISPKAVRMPAHSAVRVAPEASALHSHLQARQTSMTNADIMAKWADLGNRRRATNEAQDRRQVRYALDGHSGDDYMDLDKQGVWASQEYSKQGVNGPDWLGGTAGDDAGWEQDYEWVGGWHDLHL